MLRSVVFEIRFPEGLEDTHFSTLNTSGRIVFVRFLEEFDQLSETVRYTSYVLGSERASKSNVFFLLIYMPFYLSKEEKFLPTRL